MLALCAAGAWDSNGDGIGDFEGIRLHLDYLVKMGISGIWLIHVTRFDDDFEWHGLVAQDWFDVDPLYGTMADFDRLMSDCAKRDFKIILTSVPEYVGWHHPDYVAAKKAHDEGLEDSRKNWFLWEDDGTVTTVWSHPGPDLSNPDYMQAYLRHVKFWMDKGIAGWHADAVQSWLNLKLEAVQTLTGYVKQRGGLIMSEYNTRKHDIVRQGGFNAGSGEFRSRLYHETKAILEQDADYIRQGLSVRRELIDLGMFPYQQFGLEIFDQYTSKNPRHKLPMYRLQVAFNAALPDLVLAFANSIAYPTRKLSPGATSENLKPERTSWYLDLSEIEKQELDASSPLNFVRRMFGLRKEEKALSIGEIKEIHTDKRKAVFVALRISEDGTERAVTAFNFSSEFIDVTLLLKGSGISSLKNYLSGEIVHPDKEGNLAVRMGYFGFKFWKVVD
jgi:glycosidase